MYIWSVHVYYKWTHKIKATMVTMEDINQTETIPDVNYSLPNIYLCMYICKYCVG